MFLECLIKSFCMQNSHFLLHKLDEPNFQKNLDVFFKTYPYIHINNTLLINNTLYKKCSIAHFDVLLSPLINSSVNLRRKQ
jgi:hypothetical protein